MAEYEETRDSFATGNAEGLQKLEIDGFVEETQIWAWDFFKTMAKSLSRKNHFKEAEWTSMESVAIGEILSDDAIVYEPASGKTVQEYLRGVIARKLKQAAGVIADERSIWAESRRSLDATGGTEDEMSTLGDLVVDGADLNVNRKFIEQPRAVRNRNTIKRLRNAKNHAALKRFRASLCGETVEDDESEFPNPKGEEIQTENPFAVPPPDEFADDAEMLNRSVFDAQDHHCKAVAEVGYAPDEDDEQPQRPFKVRSPGFGNHSVAQNRLGLKSDVKELMRTLPPKYQDWCRRVKQREDPVETYKALGIPKNEYYKKLLPLMRKVFAELDGSY